MDQDNLKTTERLVDIAYHRPMISDSFKNSLKNRIVQQYCNPKVNLTSSRTRAWSLGIASAVLLLLCISILIVGPTKVMAQIAKWFGYSASTGLVSEPSSVMTLTESVETKIDNFTVLVPSASISTDRTTVEYLVFQGSTETKSKTDSCKTKPYLTLLESNERYEEITYGQFPILPDSVKQIYLHIPCLSNTNGEGSIAVNIPLNLQLAKEDLVTQENNFIQQKIMNGLNGSVHILQTFQDENSLILVSELGFETQTGNFFHISGIPIIQDADGSLLAYESPMGYESLEGSDYSPLQYNFKISTLGVSYPITITIPVNITNNQSIDMFDGDQEIWSVIWSPAKPVATSNERECITAENIKNLTTAPNQEVSSYLVKEPGGHWLMFSIGGQPVSVAENAISLAISHNRELAALINEQGVTIRSLKSGVESTYPGQFSGKLIWNGDSDQVAVQSGNSLFVLSVDAKLVITIPVPDGSMLVGWGKGSHNLLFASPELFGHGYILRDANLAAGEIKDIFYLEHSASKNINLQISPDSALIAYRGDRQATLMIKNLITGEQRAIIDAASTFVDPTAIDYFFWSSDSNEIVVDIQQPGMQGFYSYLINAETCQIKSLKNNSGSLQEVFIEP